MRFRRSPVCDLIVNADDFGRSSEINEAVLLAYKAGVLTSASLMVTGEAAAEAAALARRMPGLAVGLHVVLTGGRPVLPPGQVSHLVADDGLFAADPLRAAVRYWLLDRVGRQELCGELTAQFERFAASGLELSHVDGHCHLHVHPVVFRFLAPLARRYGARGFRLPRDSFFTAYRHQPGRAWRQFGSAVSLALLAAWHAPRLRRLGLATAARTHGVFASGNMRVPYVIEVLDRLSERLVELYFHPTLGPRLDRVGPNPRDLKTLMSRAVRRALHQPHVRLTNYLRLPRS